ncbi:PR domain zinc finger protein 14-like [Lineus longissimus]|uniref:PR domain zinc finger protein 14-like n=1 Tax=Lineus longissimus TaxID=88925 RepID=UPI002B4CF8A0
MSSALASVNRRNEMTATRLPYPSTSHDIRDLKRAFPSACNPMAPLNPRQEHQAAAFQNALKTSVNSSNMSSMKHFPYTAMFPTWMSPPLGTVEMPPPWPPTCLVPMFNTQDLDMVLYGYVRSKENGGLVGHALSGLRINELSHGIEKILSPKLGGGHGSARDKSSTLIEKTTLNLPEGLKIVQTSCAGATHYGVFCEMTVIARGTRFGPFSGKVVHTSEIKTNDDNSFMWEVFKDGRLSHFIDGRGSTGNWMAYVNCARYAQEQNLIAIQTEGQIYYEACKDLPRGSELLVWYGDSYLQFMGIPVALKDMMSATGQEDVDGGEGFTCERCGKVFAYQYYRDKHLKYTRCVDQGDRKFPCHLCTRSFEKRDRLRIHILHVHEKHRPHHCTVCGKSFSQSSSLNKHMRVHSGERPYKCVYCSKAFTASSILRTHIRQHSGEKPFKCKFCGKAFASHAAHDSHMRRTHTRDKLPSANLNRTPEKRLPLTFANPATQNTVLATNFMTTQPVAAPAIPAL